MNNKNYFVHPNALVESNEIGKNTRIWAFAHILKNVSIGEDCNICDHCFIESGVSIGNRVTMKNGIALWEGVTVEDDVFLGPFCVFTNDMFPRSKAHNHEFLKTIIKNGASIGANSTILCGIEIGRYALVGAGSVVTRSIPDFAVVTGNPARTRYWISKSGERLAFNSDNTACDSNGIKYFLTKNSSEGFDDFVKEIE